MLTGHRRESGIQLSEQDKTGLGGKSIRNPECKFQRGGDGVGGYEPNVTERDRGGAGKLGLRPSPTSWECKALPLYRRLPHTSRRLQG